jgi:hypothetical protein
MKLTFCTFILFISNNIFGQIFGCTDPLANNYNSNATFNNGSCLYDVATINPSLIMLLPNSLDETSGLIFYNNRIWSQDDDTDISIYSINPNNSNDIVPYTLTGTFNKDWEEISQDASYVYIGDFGNNATGNRQDLKILRIEKNALLSNQPIIDTISFSYSLQTDFSVTAPNKTNFDCEAFVVTSDSIYLFTKEWVTKQTSLYSLPKVPGNYTAQFRNLYNVNGLITGATFLQEDRLIVLSGYSSLLQPFLFLLYDFTNNDFFNGNKRKIEINAPLHQVEGIATEDKLHYFISNERFVQSLVIVEQKLQQVDLTSYLNGYLYPAPTGLDGKQEMFFNVYPNPSNTLWNVHMSQNLIGKKYSVVDLFGKEVLRGEFNSSNLSVDNSTLTSGVYFLKLDDSISCRVVKK